MSAEGVEPPTDSLRGSCSTIELPAHLNLLYYLADYRLPLLYLKGIYIFLMVNLEGYRAPDFEVNHGRPPIEIGHLLQEIIPPQFSSDDPDSGGMVCRFFRLPQDPGRRVSRVQEIAQKGTDCTRFFTFANLITGDKFAVTGILNALVRPNNYFYGLEWRDFIRRPIEGNCGSYRANAMLVYDAVTEIGVRSCSQADQYPQVFTFRSPSQGNLALLAIVGFNGVDLLRFQAQIKLSPDSPLMRSMTRGR